MLMYYCTYQDRLNNVLIQRPSDDGNLLLASANADWAGWLAGELAASAASLLRITTGAKLVDYSGRVAGRRQVMSFVKLTAVVLYSITQDNLMGCRDGSRRAIKSLCSPDSN